MSIGFVEREKPIFGDDVVLRLDDGAAIDMRSACHNTLVLGATGTGKTWSAILPMADRLMAHVTSEGARLGGLVVDVKGNFTEQIGMLAAANGREEDIVRLGIQEGAEGSSLIAGIGEGMLHDFFRQMVETINGRDERNGIWLARGVALAVDCAIFLRLGAKIFPGIFPTLGNVRKMLSDPLWATALAMELEDKLPEAQADMVRKRRSNAFHVCNWVPNGSRGGGQKSSDYEAQVAWTTDYVLTPLDEILSIPGMSEAIDDAMCRPFDAGRFVTGGKIGIVRFGPESGRAGGIMARWMIGAYYKAVYAAGTTREARSFLLADEFQQFADLSGSRLSDDSFTSQAREFGAVCCYATQSAAMLNKDFRESDGFLANCCNRICFWSDDIRTNDLFSAKAPFTLDSGECAYTILNAGERRRHSGVSSLDGEHERIVTKFGNEADSFGSRP